MELVEAVKQDALICRDEMGAIALMHDGSEPAVVRRRIERLKDWLFTLGELWEPRIEHEVTGGMYLRKLFIPKGTVLVGKVHLKPCHNVVAKGEITVLTETGCQRIGAGFTGMSSPGSQKVGLTHEDTVFINVFRTDKTTLEEIEAEIACEASADAREGLACL